MSKKYLYIISFIFLYNCSYNQSKKTGNPSDMDKINRTPETQALFDNMNKLSKHGVMFGHQDDLAYGIGWTGGAFNSDIQKVCGDYPAVFGWDIGHIGSSHNIDSVPFPEMRRWIIEVFQRGGVNTISWHHLNPLTGQSSWDTTRVVDAILPGGNLHVEFCKQLDTVAGFFTRLVTLDNVKVPVIFRPFHEHNGGWFWWGNKVCSDEEYKQLFQFTVDYLNEKQVNNVLYCYSTDVFNGEEDYLQRYPGDEYVDVLGFDDYQSIRSEETLDLFISRLKTVGRIARKRGKVAVFSETGFESVPVPDWWTSILLRGIKEANAGVAYVLVWRNANEKHHFAPFPGHASSESFMEFKNDSKTYFLGNISGLYNEDK